MKRPRSDDFTGVALSALSSLYNAAYRLTGNEHDAEELVQETYLQAFEHADQLQNLGKLKAWLLRIMRNRLISLDRRRRARPELVVLEGGIDAATSPSDLALQNERLTAVRFSREAINHALSRLPEEFSTAIVMCDIEGLSYQEIAEVMECPVGTVRSRIARGRARLSRMLVAEAGALGIGTHRSGKP